MKYLRIGAISPPQESRTAWARELLAKAMNSGLSPILVPQHEVTGFTANLQPHLADWLEEVARNRGVSPAVAAAGLIAAVQRDQTSSDGESKPEGDTEPDELLAEVNPDLRDLARAAQGGMDAGKIAFCEGATGTGKGRMLMYFALKAIAKQAQVVVSAPLPIVRQLIDDLWRIPDGRSVKVVTLLGRPNFVSPEALVDWATEAECQPILDWIDRGGRPADPHTIELGSQIGVELCWLLEEAMTLADEIPVSRVMLSGEFDPDEACEAEQVYAALREQAKHADLIFCSHHLLAYHCRQMQLKAPLALPEHIDLLLVDEAHLLEQAFASIFSQTLHLSGLERTIQHSSGTRKTAALAALNSLGAVVRKLSLRAPGKPCVGPLNDMDGLSETCGELIKALEGMAVKKKDKVSSRALSRARGILRDCMSGMSTIGLELTPVQERPLLTSGQSNLQRPFELLWDSVAAGALVSATLYTDGVNAGLMRWKVAVPKPRAQFLAPVIPAWVKSPVTLMKARVAITPDESDDWHDALAEQIEQVAAQAVGGTLVLATAYATIEGLKQRLAPVLGERLICQSSQLSSSAGAAVFRVHGNRPVWLAVGSAWTGIDLSDKSVRAEEDFMLTDLVICRLPFGANRSLTHHRRMQIAGQGVNIQETVWHLRQGIGRLVRRPGVPNKKLWILDCRIDSKESWMASFRSVMKEYRTE